MGLSHCAIDSSDGLTSCFYELARRGREIDLHIDLADVPAEPAVAQVAEAFDLDVRKLLLAWGDWELVCTVEEAVKLGADAVSVHINLGADTDKDMLRQLGFVSERCMEWQMPLVAMMYTRGAGSSGSMYTSICPPQMRPFSSAKSSLSS